MRLTRHTLAIIIVLLLSNPGDAEVLPDMVRELRISGQIEPAIFDGEAVWLDADGTRFLSIHMPVEKAHGAVILLHGRDTSPEEQELIGPLRVGLAEAGWTTLALQMPVLAKGKKYYDYLPVLKYAHPRIEAAIDYLQTQNESKIILAAHSCGAHMANDWLNHTANPAVDGYIAMGTGATDAEQDLKTPLPFANLSVPVLDIYGSEEFPRPLLMVPYRQELLKLNGNPLSSQVLVDGANHYFTGYGDEMTGELISWLNTLKN